MQAIGIQVSGEERKLLMGEAPQPAPGPDQVLVRVAAIGVNRADLGGRVLRPSGGDGPGIPGLDVAGTVAAVGAEVSGWREGDLVIALVTGGAYAQFAPARAVLAYPPPRGMGLPEAASLPCVFLTAWYALTKLAAVQPGETVLIHAAGSGVGMAGIQIAKALGARVLTTAGSDAKLARGRELGAEAGVNYATMDLTAELLRLTQGRGVDVVLDSVGGAVFDATLPALAQGGRIVTVGNPAGSRAELDQAMLGARSQRVQPMSVFTEAAADTEQRGWAQLKGWFEDGTLRTVIDRVLPWSQAEVAHRLLVDRAIFGKIVLTVDA